MQDILKLKESAYILGSFISSGLMTLLVWFSFFSTNNPFFVKENIHYISTALPVALFINTVSITGTIGCIISASFIFPKRDLNFNIATIGSILWVLSGTVVFFLSYIQMSNQSLKLDNSFTKNIAEFLFTIPIGQAWGIIVTIGLITSILTSIARSQSAILLTNLISILVLIPKAVIGHSFSSSNHSAAVNLLGLHTFGISIWFGGLVVLAFGVRNSSNFKIIIQRFSKLALFSYIIVFFSGIGSAYIRIGSIYSINTIYGHLVIIKTIGLILLGIIGFMQRKSITSKNINFKIIVFKLIINELFIIGLIYGITIILTTTVPPINKITAMQEMTLLEIFIGEKLPDFPNSTYFTFFLWKIDYLWLTLSLVMVITYLKGYLKMRLRGDRWPYRYLISWIIGCTLLFLSVSTGPAVYSNFLMSAHMIEHMILTMVIPLFLVKGAPIILLLKTVKSRKDMSWGPREWTLNLLHSSYAKLISNPIFASLNFMASIIIFYYTPLFKISLLTHVGHELMIIHFLLTGYLFVQSMIGVDPIHKQYSHPIRFVLLLSTMAFHAFFGISLINSKVLLQPNWFDSISFIWNYDPLRDQQIAGTIAWGLGEIPTVVIAVMITFSWIKSDQIESKRFDRHENRNHNLELNKYNDMLNKLNNTY